MSCAWGKYSREEMKNRKQRYSNLICYNAPMMDELSIDQLAKILWDYNCLYDDVTKADAIIVLGSHDIRVAQRGAQLFLQGYAPLLVFSGNVGRLTEGKWDKTEAEIFADVAIKMGVPEEKILIEKASTNTGENIEFTKALLNEKGISIHNVILVQKPYMQRRSLATCKKIWPEVKVQVTAPEISFENYPNEQISKDDLINIMVGDTQRIKVYAEKGYQIYQEMPDNVWQAYEELVKRGFTKHVIEE